MVFTSLNFERILFVHVTQLSQVFVAIERVVVQVDLGINGQNVALLSQREWVDLGN